MIPPSFIGEWILAPPNRMLPELSAAPHRLLDILDPAEAYSAADFRRDALAAMAGYSRRRAVSAVSRRNSVVFQKRCWKDCPPLPSADQEVRARIEQQACARAGIGMRYISITGDRSRGCCAVFIQMIRKGFSRALEVFISGKTQRN